jgi:hypothetical protein
MLRTNVSVIAYSGVRLFQDRSCSDFTLLNVRSMKCCNPELQLSSSCAVYTHNVIVFTASARLQGLRLQRLLILTRNVLVSEKLPQWQGDSEYLETDGN